MKSLYFLLILPLFLASCQIPRHSDPPEKSIGALFAHPGVMHSQESLNFIRSKVAAQEKPWYPAWQKLQKSKSVSLSWKPSPFPRIDRGPYNDPDIGSSEFLNDGHAAYTHALNWALSENEASARKAAEILDAWSTTLETVAGHDARLLIGMAGLRYIAAAELLVHTWDGWSKEGQATFVKMLREIWYPLIKDFYPSANGNWDAAMMQTMIAIGVFLEDREIFDRAANYYLHGKGNGPVRNYFKKSGQSQETGRDQAHTQMGLEFLVNTCETAWIQGYDLYGVKDNRLLKGFEYTAKFNLGEDVPYEPYRSYQGRYHYKKISNKARGRLRPMYEKALNHYHHRKNLPTPYAHQVVHKKRPESGGGSSLPWSSLMFANLSQETHKQNLALTTP